MKIQKLLPLFCCVALLLPLLAFAPKQSFTIFMIGDSTMANKNLTGGNPERGWGHVLPGFFSEDVRVDNHAVNGQSSKSFIDDGRWDAVISQVKPGDYVFIQFGHNDQKTREDRYTQPGSTFDANLKRFITETRAKGGTPVLFTSIVRRQFDENGLLKDTHGDYITATKNVARETNTLLIDLCQQTHDWIQALGDEATRQYFMWVPKNTLPCCPEGKEDNTHLNVAGAKIVAGMAVQSLGEAIPEMRPFFRQYDFVVAQDGSGDFFTVQEAINAVPDYRKEARTRILIRKGEYKEKLIVPENKIGVSLIGEEGAVLTYDDYAQKKNIFGEDKSTSGSASSYLYGDNFYAENITFCNSAGPVGQAVAALVAGDRTVFKRCRFLGFQDTLYTYGMNSRQYYEECYIEGSVDFIFGWSTVVFNRCHIHNKRNGYVTAPATPEGRDYGYVFLDCELTADEGVDKVYLSRPWRDYAKAVFIRCQLGRHILPEGWHNWNKKHAEATIYYAEYQNNGEGAHPANRRASFARQLTNPEAYTIERILAGLDNWNPLSDPETLLLEKR
ncbi:pectinesterase family protein [Parabacteroides sp. OttesenSCG-928-J18]|nr:pectinesterase family protein [Parabacteroides sp. OttesenSCG-928-J18]